MIAKIELDRYNDEVEPIVASEDVPYYLNGLSKQNQIKLAVALELAKHKLKKME